MATKRMTFTVKKSSVFGAPTTAPVPPASNAAEPRPSAAVPADTTATSSVAASAGLKRDREFMSLSGGTGTGGMAAQKRLVQSVAVAAEDVSVRKLDGMLLAPPDDAPAVSAAAQPEEVDALDAYLNSLVPSTSRTSGKAAARRMGGVGALMKPAVITLEDLSSSTTASTDQRADDAADEDDEAYHRAFVESLRAESAAEAAAVPSGVTPAAAAPPTATAAVARAVNKGLAGLLAATKATGVPAPRATATNGPAAVTAEDMNDDIVHDAVADAEDDETTLFKGAEWEGPMVSALDMMAERLTKKELKPVDHAAVTYAPFRKVFYVESADIAALTPAQVTEIREDLEIKLRGKAIPRPISTWEQCGLPDRVLDMLTARGFAAPFAIQRQAIPAIMCGRDVIGVARTGSGKTLAYLLPMFRHVLDQPPLAEGDGPICIVLAPSRELVTQIYTEARRFGKAVGLNVAAIYGGASVGEQIAALKRGSHIVVATPGRLIDILTLNSGRVISLSRVTYVVLDEADRMFDLGFEPQISRIVGNVRPDRQTVMFSATFPSHVETLAKTVLRNPVDIVVGGRSVASSDVAQYVEVVEESGKFPRLLQLLGHWYELGSILVFVDTKEHCDTLYTDLMKLSYPCLSLHGGKDQVDRDQTLSDFKNKVATVLIATSVAGRGLDVKELVLVVNYSCPNHLEDYVHRVGRTGRAGRKGTAHTFITPSEGMYAGDMCRALKDAKQGDHITPALKGMAEEHARRVAAGEAKKRVSGYATRGFKFDDTELSATQSAKESAKRAYEIEAGIKDIDALLAERELEAETAEEREESAPSAATAPMSMSEAPHITGLRAQLAAAQVALAAGKGTQLEVDAAAAALRVAETVTAQTGGTVVRTGPAVTTAEAVRAAGSLAERLIKEQMAAAGLTLPEAQQGRHYEELEVNDYPPMARARALKRENLSIIQERNGVAVTTKGVYVAPGRKPPAQERKLYMLIEGTSEASARQARSEMRRLLEEETLRMGASLDRGGGGRSGAGGGSYGKFKM